MRLTMKIGNGIAARAGLIYLMAFLRSLLSSSLAHITAYCKRVSSNEDPVRSEATFVADSRSLVNWTLPCATQVKVSPESSVGDGLCAKSHAKCSDYFHHF
jgi:hypothetical protein